MPFFNNNELPEFVRGVQWLGTWRNIKILNPFLSLQPLAVIRDNVVGSFHTLEASAAVYFQANDKMHLTIKASAVS